jgi:hypothetical protein
VCINDVDASLRCNIIHANLLVISANHKAVILMIEWDHTTAKTITTTSSTTATTTATATNPQKQHVSDPFGSVQHKHTSTSLVSH